MKQLVIGIICFGLATLSFAQSTDGMDEVRLTDVVVTPLNLTYLNKVQDDNTPRPVIKLENKVARFNVKESPVFEEGFDAYEVIFKQTNGSIIATYDQNGSIISTLERYDQITMPYNVRNSLHKQYPDWFIHSDVYLVSYYDNKEINKVYKVQIRKDNMKKNLKVDIEGTIL